MDKEEKTYKDKRDGNHPYWETWDCFVEASKVMAFLHHMDDTPGKAEAKAYTRGKISAYLTANSIVDNHFQKITTDCTPSCGTSITNGTVVACIHCIDKQVEKLKKEAKQ